VWWFTAPLERGDGIKHFAIFMLRIFDTPKTTVNCFVIHEYIRGIPKPNEKRNRNPGIKKTKSVIGDRTVDGLDVMKMFPPLSRPLKIGGHPRNPRRQTESMDVCWLALTS
jgi:hypothetical protein